MPKNEEDYNDFHKYKKVHKLMDMLYFDSMESYDKKMIDLVKLEEEDIDTLIYIISKVMGQS